MELNLVLIYVIFNIIMDNIDRLLIESEIIYINRCLYLFNEYNNQEYTMKMAAKQHYNRCPKDKIGIKKYLIYMIKFRKCKNRYLDRLHELNIGIEG